MTPWRTAQLTTALNLTVQRVGQLVKIGVLPKPTQGHDPFTAVPAYIAFISQRLAGGDLKSARVGKYQIDTALRELEYKQKCGQLVDRSAVEGEFFRLARTT